MIEVAEGQYKALFALQFATGMRFGEIAGLHVEDLDFSELVVYIRRSTFKHEEVTPKSKAGHREVDVDAGTMAIVKSHLGDRTSGRVFESRNGTPLVNGNVNRYVLKPLCKKIGIPVGTTHAFRHGRVSVLQQGNVLGDLIKRGGWAFIAQNDEQVQSLHSGIQETDRFEIGINETDHGPKWSQLEASKTLM